MEIIGDASIRLSIVQELVNLLDRHRNFHFATDVFAVLLVVIA